MKALDIRNMNAEELTAQAKTLKEELFKLKFQLSLGQLANTAKIRQVRRDIARIKTVLNEKNA